MTEADIQADYRRKIMALSIRLQDELKEGIAAIKLERNRALELIREGERINEKKVEKPKVKTQRRNEKGRRPSQEGTQPEASLEKGMVNRQGEVDQEGAEKAP